MSYQNLLFQINDEENEGEKLNSNDIWLIFLAILLFPFSLFIRFKILQQYERAVVLRLGQLIKGCPKGPGLLVYTCIDEVHVLDIRLMSIDLLTQDSLTRDAVSLKISAVIYYRITNPLYCILNVSDYEHATSFLAVTMLRDLIGQKNLSDVLIHREQISKQLHESLDQACDTWGVVIERVELKDISIPLMMQRAMAAEAETRQEAKAKIIDADGELFASQTLQKAADLIASTPGALELRYLQTLATISVERPSTILFPIPVDFCNLKF